MTALPTPSVTPLMLRQIWSIIESSQASMLIRLDDVSLEQWILRQFRSYQVLNATESQAISQYVHTKLPLIRDVAEQKIPAMA